MADPGDDEEGELHRGPSGRWPRLAGKSEEHISRSCRKYLRKSPTELINDFRLEHAARSIASTNDKIVDIIRGRRLREPQPLLSSVQEGLRGLSPGIPEGRQGQARGRTPLRGPPHGKPHTQGPGAARPNTPRHTDVFRINHGATRRSRRRTEDPGKSGQGGQDEGQDEQDTDLELNSSKINILYICPSILCILSGFFSDLRIFSVSSVRSCGESQGGSSSLPGSCCRPAAGR
ncbi:MAG: hypothetical protein MZU97_11940 [Bacillus subtilis]|nr:hypothetical protein [Bacillus subtilis]